jgi:hypothetical protein
MNLKESAPSLAGDGGATSKGQPSIHSTELGASVGRSGSAMSTAPGPSADAKPFSATSSPSPEAVAATEEFLLDELHEAFELIRSYAVSATEAARRGDRDEIKFCLRVQLRDVFRYAVELHDLLPQMKATADRRKDAPT